MCSIVVTQNTEKARFLVNLNAVRGTHSHSFYYVSTNNLKVVAKHEMLGTLNPDHIEIPRDCIAIIHQQAPTTSIKDLSAVHPSKFIAEKDYLWHNGIIKDNICDEIRSHFVTASDWDTALLHTAIVDGGYDYLNNIDGAFACVRLKEGNFIHFFRNEIAPLFSDGESISSTEFDDSFAIKSNTVFEIYDFEAKPFLFREYSQFTTKMNPYYFGE